MRSKSILSGINVPIEPTSNVDSRVTNSILINIDKAKAAETKQDQAQQADSEVKAVYPASVAASPASFDAVTREVSTFDSNVNPYAECQGTTVDEYLRSLYETILLSNDKTLIANLISKNNIILTKEDLEQVIKRKINKEVTIDLDITDVQCCGLKTPFIKINSIRIVDDEGKSNDFKIAYNTDYLDLVSNYHINMKYVLAN